MASNVRWVPSAVVMPSAVMWVMGSVTRSTFDRPKDGYQSSENRMRLQPGRKSGVSFARSTGSATCCLRWRLPARSINESNGPALTSAQVITSREMKHRSPEATGTSESWFQQIRRYLRSRERAVHSRFPTQRRSFEPISVREMSRHPNARIHCAMSLRSRCIRSSVSSSVQSW